MAADVTLSMYLVLGPATQRIIHQNDFNYTDTVEWHRYKKLDAYVHYTADKLIRVNEKQCTYCRHIF